MSWDCSHFFFTTEIVSALKKSGKNIMKAYKQDYQSVSRPQPPFLRISFCGYAPFRRLITLKSRDGILEQLGRMAAKSSIKNPDSEALYCALGNTVDILRRMGDVA
jgi:hypothetical protein